jgi:2-methylcitrate dehydratase PrpD
LLGKYGYFKLYCQGSDPEILTRNLGEEFYGGRTTYKFYPGCGWTHPVIDCALDLVNRQNVAADLIEEVVVNIAPMHLDGPLAQPFVLGDFPQGNAFFSYRYTVANALIRKNALPEHYIEDAVRDSRVAELANKVKIISSMTSADRMDAAEVRVRLKNGGECSARVPASKGNPLVNPLTVDEIMEKFWHNVDFSGTVRRKDAEKALDMINNLETVKDTGELVALLLAPPKRSK